MEREELRRQIAKLTSDVNRMELEQESSRAEAEQTQLNLQSEVRILRAQLERARREKEASERRGSDTRRQSSEESQPPQTEGTKLQSLQSTSSIRRNERLEVRLNKVLKEKYELEEENAKLEKELDSERQVECAFSILSLIITSLTLGAHAQRGL